MRSYTVTDDDWNHLCDMKNALEEIISYVHEESNIVNPVQQRMLVNAYLMQCQRFGEATSKISSDFEDYYDELSWSKFPKMRHVISHDYNAINLNVINKFIVNAPDIYEYVLSIYNTNIENF